MTAPKYIFPNGVMTLNPDYVAQQTTGASSAPATTVAKPALALAIISSPDDVMVASIQAPGGAPIQMADSVISSMATLQDPGFLAKFGSQNNGQQLDGGEILDALSRHMERHEVPNGMTKKLLPLVNYSTLFAVDDSGSMSIPTELLIAQDPSPEVRARATQNRRPSGQQMSGSNSDPHMTRFEEAESRIHSMIDYLALIPSGPIRIRFFNRRDELVLQREGRTPDQFAAHCHQQVSALFDRAPAGGTPLLHVVQRDLADIVQFGPTMYYLFSDGQPSSAYEIPMIHDLIVKRPNPERCPVTLVPCSDDENDTAWMPPIERAAPYCAQVDDFKSEQREVLIRQGPGLPYSYGFWLMSLLAAAINPYDLDAFDDPKPLTLGTLVDVLGRVLSKVEYDFYWVQHPQTASYYNRFYNEFLRMDIAACQIAC